MDTDQSWTETSRTTTSRTNRRKRGQNHTTQRGKISFRILSGRSKRCLQNASERRGIARDWSKWNIVEVLVDKGAFEGLCSVRLRVVCARFKQRRLVSLSLSGLVLLLLFRRCFLSLAFWTFFFPQELPLKRRQSLVLFLSRVVVVL